MTFNYHHILSFHQIFKWCVLRSFCTLLLYSFGNTERAFYGAQPFIELGSASGGLGTIHRLKKVENFDRGYVIVPRFHVIFHDNLILIDLVWYHSIYSHSFDSLVLVVMIYCVACFVNEVEVFFCNANGKCSTQAVQPTSISSVSSIPRSQWPVRILLR